MRLLLCRGWRNTIGLEIETLVRAEFPGLAVEHYAAVESLVFRLRHSGNLDIVCALLIPATAVDLEEMVARNALFAGLKVLLVLPNHDPASIANGHRLRPSLMAFNDGDPAQVCAVLDKIIGRRLSDVA